MKKIVDIPLKRPPIYAYFWSFLILTIAAVISDTYRFFSMFDALYKDEGRNTTIILCIGLAIGVDLSMAFLGDFIHMKKKHSDVLFVVCLTLLFLLFLGLFTSENYIISNINDNEQEVSVSYQLIPGAASGDNKTAETDENADAARTARHINALINGLSIAATSILVTCSSSQYNAWKNEKRKAVLECQVKEIKNKKDYVEELISKTDVRGQAENNIALANKELETELSNMIVAVLNVIKSMDLLESEVAYIEVITKSIFTSGPVEVFTSNEYVIGEGGEPKKIDSKRSDNKAAFSYTAKKSLEAKIEDDDDDEYEDDYTNVYTYWDNVEVNSRVPSA